MVIAKLELPPIEVTIKDQAGNPITGAHVQATYTHSGLSSSGTSDQDGMATVPLLYCDNEPMRVEAVATGYQADNVGEFRRGMNAEMGAADDVGTEPEIE